MNPSGNKRPVLRPLAGALALLALAAVAGEIGMTRQAVDVLAEPYRDARPLSQLGENARVEILERRGGWLRIRSNGAAGWVKLYQVRLGEGKEKTSGEGLKMLRSVKETGRSGAGGIVATTGVRGLNAEDLKNAKPNPKAVQTLEANRANEQQAREQARAVGLREKNVAYLAKPEE